MQTFIRRGQEHKIAGYPDWMASLLYARGVTTAAEAQAFLNPSAAQLLPPEGLHQLPQAVQLIRQLGQQRARAVVYGDYDVDGLCAAVIASEALKEAGLQVSIYIPDRHTEGYGLNEDAVRTLAQDADLLVTVDCGIKALHEVQVAKDLGMSVIVTDHHQPGEQLPAADAVINPLLGDYPFNTLCGAATAWKLSMALHGWAFAEKQLDLAAVATIADMVPLLGENRVLAALGLQKLANTPRVGLSALKAAMGLEQGVPVSADRVSFGLAPRLNAGGRLTTAQDALSLLTATDAAQAHELALKLNQVNADRQQEERQVIDQAEQLLDGVDMLNGRSIVLYQEGWNSGVVGLAAGRLAEKYGYPAVVLSQQGERCTGSGRSAGGLDLYAALSDCKDLFLRFGGHRQAAGLSILTENVPAFAARFDQAIKAQLDGRPLLKQIAYDAPLDLGDVSLDMIRGLNALAPFGIGNPGPAFLLEDVQVQAARAVGAEGRHLKLSLRAQQAALDGIAWQMGEYADGLPPRLRAVVKLDINEYQGRQSPQAQVTAFQAGAEAFTADPARERQAVLRDLQGMAGNDTLFDVEVSAFSQEDPLPEQGALLFCRCFDTAQAMRKRYPAFHTATGAFRDRRGSSTILYAASLADVEAPFSHVVLCDGPIAAGEAALAAARFPGARLLLSPRSDALKAHLANLRPTVDELRQAYVHLRNGGQLYTLPGTREKAQAMGLMLRDMGLIDLNGQQVNLLAPSPTEPVRSALYQLLNEEDVWPTQSLKS